jgi:hypothetical protein
MMRRTQKWWPKDCPTGKRSTAPLGSRLFHLALEGLTWDTVAGLCASKNTLWLIITFPSSCSL